MTTLDSPHPEQHAKRASVEGRGRAHEHRDWGMERSPICRTAKNLPGQFQTASPKDWRIAPARFSGLPGRGYTAPCTDMREVQETSEPLDVSASAAWPSACWGSGGATLQGSQSQLRVGVSDPPCGCEAKRTSMACLRNQPEGPGPVGQGPNTLHRSLAMELRRQWASPAGCRGQLRLAISGRNGRSGARVDAHRQRKLA